MNHEPTIHPESEPRHRREEDLAHMPMTGDAFVASIIEVAPDETTASRLAETYAHHGTAFAIYLALGDTNLASPTIENDYKNSFIGFYWSREALIDDTIASFDWGSELHHRLAHYPLLRSMVRLDHDAIWAFANDHYEIIDLDGGLYVYEPET